MLPKAIALIVLSLTLLSNGRTDTRGLKVGDKASGFDLENVDGRQVSLEDFDQAKGFVVVFTCNTCPYAKAYESRIIALHNKFAPVGFPVIAINSNDAALQPGDSFDAMKERAKTKKYPFPYLQDKTQEVAKQYGATKTPQAYLLRKDRTVAYIGAIDNNYRDAAMADKKYLSDAVEALLNGQKVSIEETKAIGCGIKWKDA